MICVTFPQMLPPRKVCGSTSISLDRQMGRGGGRDKDYERTGTSCFFVLFCFCHFSVKLKAISKYKVFFKDMYETVEEI